MRAKAITRLIVTAVLLINAILTAAGKNPIPLDETAVGEIVSGIAAGLATIWSWWKNNNITAASQAGQIVTDEAKAIKEVNK